MEDTDRPIEARPPRRDPRGGSPLEAVPQGVGNESAVTDCLRRRFCEQTTGQPIESIPLALEAQDSAAIHCIGATVQCLQELQSLRRGSRKSADPASVQAL